MKRAHHRVKASQRFNNNNNNLRDKFVIVTIEYYSDRLEYIYSIKNF